MKKMIILTGLLVMLTGCGNTEEANVVTLKEEVDTAYEELLNDTDELVAMIDELY